MAVYGGALPLTMLRRLMIAEAVENAEAARTASGNSAQWAEDNPRSFALLAGAEVALKELKDD